MSISGNDKIAKHNLIYCALKIQSTKIDVKRENREINIADVHRRYVLPLSRFCWYAFNMEFISCNLAKVTRGVGSWELFCWLTNGDVIYGAIVHAIWHREIDKSFEKCIRQSESPTCLHLHYADWKSFNFLNLPPSSKSIYVRLKGHEM